MALHKKVKVFYQNELNALREADLFK